MDMADQVILLSMITRRKLLGIPLKKVGEFNRGFIEHVLTARPDIHEEIAQRHTLSDESYEALGKLADEYKGIFLSAGKDKQ